MQKARIELLQRMPIFGGIRTETLHFLVDLCPIVSVPAHHFFFRRMIPLADVSPRAGWPPYAIASLDYAVLREGADAGLDLVCRGILEGAPFVYDGEIAAPSSPERALI